MLERYEFKNGTIATFDNEQNLVSYNGKDIYKLKGQIKSISFKNKKDELDGVVLKCKDLWGSLHYIAINQTEYRIRKSPIKCLEIIPTLEKDKSKRVCEIEELRV